MYIVEIYEQDFSDEYNSSYLAFVGKMNGEFLTEEEAELTIKSQSVWCQRNLIFKVVEVKSNEHY